MQDDLKKCTCAGSHQVTKGEEKVLARRSFLSGSGFLAAGALMAGSMTGLINSRSAEGQEAPAAWPFPYFELDPELAAQIGYAGYFEGACCYGTIKGILGQLADTYGQPYNLIPLDMFKYGEGGIAGWASTCGTINGASAAINLVCNMDDARKVINELIAWYCNTALPIYVPDGQEAMVKSVADSPLCHASVSLWCKEAKYGVTSSERKERCARLVADVASKTVSLLNDLYQGSFVSVNKPSETVTECMSCHGSNVLNNSFGKMSCTSCHDRHQLAPIQGWNAF